MAIDKDPVGDFSDKFGDELQSLPENVARILATLDDPNSSAHDVEEALATDPSMSAKVLALVNSAYFGFSSEVGTLARAVPLLGFKTVRQIALATSLLNLAPSIETENGFSVVENNYHAATSGVLAKLVARHAPRGGYPGEAFTGGLLHDIGKNVLATHLPEGFDKVERRILDDGVDWAVAEQKELHDTHANVGAQLLRRWLFPKNIVEATDFHHRLKDATAPVASAVHLADAICNSKGVTCGLHAGKGKLAYDNAALTTLGLGKEQLDLVLSEVDGELERAAPFLHLLRD